MHPPVNRRLFLSAGSSALAGALFAGEDNADDGRTPVVPLGIPVHLEPLAFDFEALEPHLDAATLRLHYAHHSEHQAQFAAALRQVHLVVGNVSTLMAGITTVLEPADPTTSVIQLGKKPGPLPPDIQHAIRMHGGAHVNHTIFWRFLAPRGTGPAGPEGRVAQAIQAEFGSIEAFKSAFTDAALRHFGSGWAWLVYRPDGRLVITTTANEDNPLMKDFVDWRGQGRPILALDLWEHAYYGRYKNDRRAYIAAWWNVVNWSFLSRAYAIVTSGRA